MLDELTTIPWYELDHAHGSAEEIPIWIRRLTSQDKRVQEQALSQLENAICHQGSIYPSTAYVIPFFLELLQEPAFQMKADILELLAFIVLSNATAEIVETWTWMYHSSSRVPFKDAAWEISQGLPLYRMLLADTHPKKVRLEAANLIIRLAAQTDLLSADQREHLFTDLQPLSPVLEEVVVHEKGRKATVLVETLLFLWFPREEQAIRWTRMELTKQQDRVLSLFYNRSDLWEESCYAYNFLDVLKAYQLPEEQSVMADFLQRELSPPSPQPQDHQRVNTKLPAYHRSFHAHLLQVFREQFSRLHPDILLPRIGDATGPMGRLLRADVPSLEGSVYQDGSQRDVFFHLPDSPAAIWEMKREYQLLCLLQGRLPLPIPNPLYVHLGTEELGRIFMGYPCFPGRPLYQETWECLERIEGEKIIQLLAHQIASFLDTLHHIPVTEVATVALPVIHKRGTYETLFRRVRLDLFPHLPLEQCRQLATSFSTFLNTPDNFTLTPVLVHGSFGLHNIIYHGLEHVISGIIGFTHAGLGDPAADIAPLFGPCGYGKKFRQFFEEAYPDFSMLRERIEFYVNASFLQDAFTRYGQHSLKHIVDEFTFFQIA